MYDISIEDYADQIVKLNPGMNRRELIKDLRHTLRRKADGAVCDCCGAPIWAALTGSDLCPVCALGTCHLDDEYEIYDDGIEADSSCDDWWRWI